MATPQEMATEVVKAWISGKSTSADHLAQELKKIYAAMVEAYSMIPPGRCNSLGNWGKITRVHERK